MTKEKFVKAIQSFERSKSVGEHFRNFLTLAHCTYAKQMSGPERAAVLEEEYMRIVGTYRDKDDVRRMPELIAMIFEGVHSQTDFLGSVSGELSVLDARAGRFFSIQEPANMTAIRGHPLGSALFFQISLPASGGWKNLSSCSPNKKEQQ